MAQAYKIGEGAVRIFPNFEGFHRKVQAYLQQESKRIDSLAVELELNKKQFERDLKAVKAELAEIDGDAISVDLLIDSEDAYLEYKRLQAWVYNNPLKVRMKLDDKAFAEAHSKFKAFAESHDRIDAHLLLHRNAADDEMRDFKAKHDGQVIHQYLKVHQDPISMPKYQPTTDVPFNPAKQIKDSMEGWDAINFTPKLFKTMEAQFEQGMKQMYDPYVRFMVRMGTAMRQPFEDFDKWIMSKNSFAEVFDDVVQRWGTGLEKSKNMLKSLRTHLDSTRKFLSSLKAEWKDVSDAFWKMKFPAALKQWGNWLKSGIVGHTKKFTAAITDAFEKLRTLPSRIGGVRGAMQKLPQLFSRVGKQISSSLWLAMQKAAGSIDIFRSFGFKLDIRKLKNIIPTEFARHLAAQFYDHFRRAKRFISNGIGELFHFGKSWALVGRKAMADLVTGLTNNRVWNGVRNTMRRLAHSRIGQGLRNGMRGALRGFRNFGSLLTRHVGPALGRMGSIIGRTMGRWAAHSQVFFKAFRGVMRRASQYVIGFSRVALGAFFKIGRLIGAVVLPAVIALGAGLAALGGKALIGQILVLANAFVVAAQGALALVPALAAAAGISFAALKIGLAGVKTGVSAAFNAKTVEEFEEAIKDLPPEVQSIAREMRQFKTQWDDIKKGVQGNLLKDLGPAMSGAMKNLLPAFGDGLKGIASEWNGALRLAFAELSTSEAQNGVKAIMEGVREMSNEMKPVIANLLAAFGSLAEQGAKFLKPIGTYFADASQRFRDWAEGMKEIDPSTGMSKFDTLIQSAVHHAGMLKDIFGGVFGTLGNILQAAGEGGGGLLSGMAEAAQRLKEATAQGTEGYEQLLEFFKSATQAASLLGDVIGPVLGIVTTLGSVLANFATGAIPGLVIGLEGLKNGLAPIKTIAEEAGAAFGNILASMGPALESLGAALVPLLEGLFAALEPLGTKLFEALTPILDAFIPAFTAFQPVLMAVGEALGSMFEALSPLLAQAVEHLSLFMPLLTSIFEWIGKLGTRLIEVFAPLTNDSGGMIQKVTEAFQPLVDILGNALMNIINALAPAIPVVMEAINGLVDAILPLVPVLGQVIEFLGTMLVDAINWVLPILPPLASAIGSLASIISSVLVFALQLLLTVVKAVWVPINFIISNAVNIVIVPLLKVLAAIFRGTAEVIKTYIHNFVVPALKVMQTIFEAMGNAVRSVVNNVIKPAMDFFMSIFDTAVAGVSAIWSSLKQKFAEPVKFFIDVVINQGIVRTWNTISDKFLGGKLEKLNPVASLGAYARGGVINAPYSPGRDNMRFWSANGTHLDLSGGEAVMRPEWTRAVGGPAAVEAMNHQARVNGVSGVRKMLGEGAAFAKGGIIGKGLVKKFKENKDNLLDAKIEGLFNELKSEHGKPYQYGGTGNPSWDCSGIWSGITQYLNGGNLRGGRIFNTESNFEQFGFRPGLNGRVTIGIMRGGGGPNSHMAGTIDGVNIESAGDHGVQIGGSARGSDHSMFNIHYTLADYLGEFISGGAGGGSFSFFAYIARKVGELIKEFIDPVLNQMKQFTGLHAQLPITVAEHVVDGVKEFIMSKIPRFGAGSYDGAGGVSGDAESWREMAKEAMRRNGFDANDEAQVNAMIRQIQTESGGIPGRVQEIHDINGTGESAGVGLLQIIPGTFAENRDPSLPNDRKDPWANMNASLRYYKKRYGNNLTTHWGKGHGYDSGGIGNGIGYLPKYTLEPERVLSPRQTKAFDMLIYQLLPQMFNDWLRQPYDLQEGFLRLQKGLQGIQGELARQRDEFVDAWAGNIKEVFKAREEGRQVGEPVDFNKIFEGDREQQDRLVRNLNKAYEWTSAAAFDPEAYLKAEEVALERLAEEKDAAKKQEQEERRKQQEESTNSEKEALTKQREEEDSKNENLSEEEKKAIEERRKAEDEAIEERSQKEQEILQEKERAEEEEIRKKKESGEYYYGYKVLGKDGQNPYAREITEEEEIAKKTVRSVGNAAGLGSIAGSLVELWEVASDTNDEIQAAIPAWYAAANGDPSGLAHNVAVVSKKQDEELEQDLKEFVPGAIGALVETVASGSLSVGRSAPLVGTINTGMTKGELVNTMTYMQSRESRRRGGGRTR